MINDPIHKREFWHEKMFSKTAKNKAISFLKVLVYGVWVTPIGQKYECRDHNCKIDIGFHKDDYYHKCPLNETCPEIGDYNHCEYFKHECAFGKDCKHASKQKHVEHFMHNKNNIVEKALQQRRPTTRSVSNGGHQPAPVRPTPIHTQPVSPIIHHPIQYQQPVVYQKPVEMSPFSELQRIPARTIGRMFYLITNYLAKHPFKVVSYNILAPSYTARNRYSYVHQNIMDVSYRQKKLVSKLQQINAEIICLQELEIPVLNFLNDFFNNNYHCFYFQKKDKPDGVGILVNKHRYAH
jgi:hypothetical protein